MRQEGRVMVRHAKAVGVMVICLLCLARSVHAQSAAIAGTVRDGTGGVLPGVTVEASSPALIEKVRIAVTDEGGQYRVLDLRPGVYAVTFSLAGFATIRREGIELSAGFTAPVNVDLRVGGIEETVVVSGQSPIVDVQNVRQQRVMTREVMDAIPTGRSYEFLGALIPGVNVAAAGRPGQDVGGTTGNAFQRLTIHGGKDRDQHMFVDGMSVTVLNNLAGSIAYTTFGDGSVEETTIGISGHSTEAEGGGVQVNIIPKSGGNELKGGVFGNFATKALQGDNFSRDLAAQGMTAPNKSKSLSDVNPSVGGPIVRDRLWFFSAFRDLRRVNFVTNSYPDADTTDYTYTPDRSVEPIDDQATDDILGRATWQVTQRNKLSVTFDYNKKREPRFAVAAARVYAQQALQKQTVATRIMQGTWSTPLTNRVLFDAGVSFTPTDYEIVAPDGAVGPSATETSNNVLFRGPEYGANGTAGPRLVRSNNYFYRGSMSYATGGHALKAGVIGNPGSVQFTIFGLPDTPYELRLLNGVPVAVVYLPVPYGTDTRMNKLALFAQDQWTLKRATVNAGLRFDWLRTSYPDYQLAATRLLPARQFPGSDVLNWKDLSPRLGFSYDVRGDGKTAMKVSLSRYVLQEAIDFTRAIDPAFASAAALTRTWVDADRDFVPDGDPLNPAANGEIGPSPNSNFGRSVLTLRYAPEWASGFAVRPYQWEASAGIQHELTSGVSLNVSYFRRWYRQFAVTDNQAVGPADFDHYCVSSPADPRLPNGGGERICDLFDLNPSKLGRLDNLGTSSTAYGDQVERWQGVDVTTSVRLPGGAMLQGGLSTGTTLTDNCSVVAKVDNPSQRFCHVETPFLTQVKFLGSYPLPAGFQMSATFQSVPGGEISAVFVARNADVAPSLGRNLSAGANSTVNINLVSPGTMYGARTNQLDLRLARTFAVSGTRLRALLDVYNVANANPVLIWNNTYGTNGAAWLRPLSILSARLVKLGLQWEF